MRLNSHNPWRGKRLYRVSGEITTDKKKTTSPPTLPEL